MKFLAISIILFLQITIFPQEKYFYSGKDYGSEALYNPLNLILNGSFDIIQLEGRSRKIFAYNYGRNAGEVFDNLKNPFSAVSKYGYWDFAINELLPFSFKKRNAQWWPNYQLHLFGGGMTFVAMKEWYEFHGIPYPKTFSAVTMLLYHSLNEIRENDNYRGINVDPIADIYFFDIGGILLFSSDNVAKFFHEELNLADWSLQPSFTLDGELHNNGQYFSIKWKIPFLEKFSLFHYFGMNGLLGASYKINDEEAVSFGAGLRGKRLEVVKETGRQFDLQTTWNFGCFYDRNNSLLASVFFSGLTDYFCNVNIYPGVLKFGNFSPGFWSILQKNGNVILGISMMYTPGIGISLNK